MQPARAQPRAPGSFSPLPGNQSSADVSRPKPRRIESSSSDDSAQLSVAKSRSGTAGGTASSSTTTNNTPIYASFTAQHPPSNASPHNFSRPTLSTAVSAARSVASAPSPSDAVPRNGPSPLTLPPTSPTSYSGRGHSRKHSQSAGLFEPTLPSTSVSNLSQIGMASASPKLAPSPHREMSASQIAAQAAVKSQQQQQQQQQQLQQAHLQAQQQQQQQHNRQRSQTVPVPGAEYEVSVEAKPKRGSGGPLSPPLLSLTEASAPRESGFGNQGYHNGLLGSHTAAATAAANVVFPRSGGSSPALSSQAQMAPLPPPPPVLPEKPVKAEKSKVKLFSRPGKIGTKGDPKEKALPSPNKIGQALSNLQRGNFSTTSLDSSAQSFYSLANSSSATIRPVDTEREVKEKEKKPHFLSRQKHKHKEDYHLPLSSAMSNSKPSDPNAPSSLYNFNLPPSPGPTTSSFKSGLDLRHGGRGLRDKKKEGAFDDSASTYAGEWAGPSSLGSTTALGSTLYVNEPFDSAKYGLNNMTLDDAWPFLKAKLIVIFEGEDLRLPVEDLNRIVSMHIQYCMTRRSPNIIVDDLRDLLATGFASLDHSLRKTPDDRLIPSLVELWIFTFTSILPYMQAVFLPLDMEFCGNGLLMNAEQARDFWGGVIVPPAETAASNQRQGGTVNLSPAASVLEVRRTVLLSFRDTVILPRYETLKTMFSRLSLEFLPQSLASMALASPLPLPSPGFHGSMGGPFPPLSASPSDSQSSSSFGLGGQQQARPGTAMSLDPGVASYNSTGTTLLGDSGSVAGAGSRSRAISNVSFGSDNTNPLHSNSRPFTPSSLHALGSSLTNVSSSSAPGGGSVRDQNVEDSKQVTDMVGRMLQCMSVLASVGHVPGGGSVSSSGNTSAGGAAAAAALADEGGRMVAELNKLLKLNWLGRGRTGRNRRGIVGGRVRRGTAALPVREEPVAE